MWNPFKRAKPVEAPLEVRPLSPKLRVSTKHLYLDRKFLEDHVLSIERRQQQVLMADRLLEMNSSKGDPNRGLSLAVATIEAYRVNATVYAAVESIAQNASSVPWILRHKVKGQNNQYEIITNHKKFPILKLLAMPQKGISAKRFFHTVFQQLYLCGNCIAWKVKVGLGIQELILLNPDHLEVVHDGIKVLSYTGKDRSPLSGKIFLPEEIIHWMLPDPNNRFWGTSPLLPMYLSIDVDRKIGEWWNNTMDKGCKKDAIIKYKQPLRMKEFRNVRNLLEQQVAGFRNGRGFMILGNEAEVEFLDYSPAELDFTNARKQTKNQIATGMRVPPSIVGDQEAQSVYGNAREARQGFWLETLLPLLGEVRDTMTVSLLPDFGLDPFEYELDFDTSDVEALQALFWEKIKASTELHAMGYPVNMVNKRMDLEMPYVEGGDAAFISANLIPLVDNEKFRELTNRKPSEGDSESKE